MHKIFYFKTHIVILILLIGYLNTLQALTVNADYNNLNCGTTIVTFTFDCSFNGRVQLTPTPSIPSITYNPAIPPNPSLIVTSGVTMLEINVGSSSGIGTLDFDFLVTKTNMESCAAETETAATSIDFSCNDECNGAVPLSIGSNSCILASYSTSNTTASSVMPNCALQSWEDLWYVFMATNQSITLVLNSDPQNFGNFALYDATNGCNNLGNPIICNIISSPLGLPSMLLSKENHHFFPTGQNKLRLRYSQRRKYFFSHPK